MKKTQIVIAVVALLALGTGGFAAYRHFSGKRAPEPQSAAVSVEETRPATTAAANTTARVTTAAATTQPQTQPATQAQPVDAVTREGLEQFLSALTQGWFALDGSYEADDPDLAEVLRFAFVHVRATDPGAVTNVEEDGVTYLAIGEDAIQTTAQAMFGLALPQEDLGAFLYRDGTFMMPAAGGLPGGGQARVRSFDEVDGRIEVSFTIGSGDDVTGTGNAVLTGTDSTYRVVEYAANSVG